MSPTKGRSLTLRLTLLFSTASAFVLFQLGLLIGHSMERHFEEQDMDVLTGKMKLARHVLERMSAPPSNETLTSQLEDALTGHHGLLVAVFGNGSEPLYANDRIDVPLDRFKPSAGLATTRPIKWMGDDGLPWRGISATVESRLASAGSYTVVVATEISHHEHFMSAFRSTLWIFMALATLAMGLLGWFVVRHGLAPLQAIKLQAEKITARRLDTRLPTVAIPLELGDLANTLNDMLARLEDSFQRLSDFSSDLAHELRTPVSNLLTQTQVTLSKLRTAAEYRDVLASNAEEFERLSRMISDMLFLAKAENNQIIPHPERLELANEVRDLFEFYEALADDKNIRLSVSGQHTVYGDRLMLRRAISNLLSNALRHTPEGGRVTVAVLHDGNGSTRLTVENVGESIAVEHLPRLFDRFYRADSSRQRTSDGSGLGLAITRTIIRAHGGEVIAESADGVTRFTVYLPEENPLAPPIS